MKQQPRKINAATVRTNRMTSKGVSWFFMAFLLGVKSGSLLLTTRRQSHDETKASTLSFNIFHDMAKKHGKAEQISGKKSIDGIATGAKTPRQRRGMGHGQRLESCDLCGTMEHVQEHVHGLRQWHCEECVAAGVGRG